jgi:hypothetical protein
VKKPLFTWRPWRADYPNPEYCRDAWEFFCRTNGTSVYGPCGAQPDGYYISGGRKCYATLEAAQGAALKALRASLRKALRDVASDLAEAWK